MQINIRELAVRGRELSYHEQLDLTEIASKHADIVSAEPLDVDLHVRYAAGAAEVKGTLRTSVTLACSRCLAPVEQPLDVAFDERFAMKERHGSEEAEESDNESDDDMIVYVTDPHVDLKPYVEEAFLLSLPFVPLCDPACKGLCPVCGGNRNETDCGCKQERIDPRLAALKDLLDS